MAFRYILSLVFLAIGIFQIASAATRPPVTTRTPPSGGYAGNGGYVGVDNGCTMPSCQPCPAGYHQYNDYTYSCSYRCLCQLTDTTKVSPGPGMSKNLLLNILHNIQNNADALEQMAKGLSDEADIAQDVAEI